MDYTNLPNDLRLLIFDYVYYNFERCLVCGNADIHWLPRCDQCGKGLCRPCYEQYDKLWISNLEKCRKQCIYCNVLCDDCSKNIISSFEHEYEKYDLCELCEKELCELCKRDLKDIYNRSLHPTKEWEETRTSLDGTKQNFLYATLKDEVLCECNILCECTKVSRLNAKKELGFLKCIKIQEVYDKSIDYATGWCTDCLRNSPSYIIKEPSSLNKNRGLLI
jgi:hypothetical protein